MVKENQKAEQLTSDQRRGEGAGESQALDHNLRFYKKFCEVPADALKKIQAGRLRGMSDVNPMWRMKRMTEIFGPAGFGWRYEIVKQWTEAYGNEVKCFCNVNLYVRDPETKEWSAPIPGNGGSSIVTMESKGAYVNDEGYKMALTDALSIAMKPLGIGANIWYGPKATGHNESKYEAYTYTRQEPSQQSRGTTGLAYTGAQLKQAVDEMDACTTEAQFNNVWNMYSRTVPALCNPGTDFYKAAQDKINAIRAPR